VNSDAMREMDNDGDDDDDYGREMNRKSVGTGNL
jgi:hypothetical protein